MDCINQSDDMIDRRVGQDAMAKVEDMARSAINSV